jgi:hypothetical protein
LSCSIGRYGIKPYSASNARRNTSCSVIVVFHFF